MQIVRTVSEMDALSSEWCRDGQRIGFVPTMGNLHAGHLSLVEKASQISDRVVVSIFINPLQFNEGSDFTAYPRTLERDVQSLAAHHVDAVFAPTENDLYPSGQNKQTWVEVPGLSDVLEGESRPGHFRGVTTVVAKLFNIVKPQIAVFGEKDFQQLLIISRMVTDLNYPINIIGMPTLRDDDGLAMSSRNSRFSVEERQKAPQFYHVLNSMAEKIRNGEQDYPALEQLSRNDLTAAGFCPDYIAVRRAHDLALPTGGDELVIVAAARLGETRLIDNIKI